MNSQSDIILFVDDTPITLLPLMKKLEQNGYQVLLAKDGEMALEKLASVKPHLIFLDVIMPKIDGFEVCQHLKMDNRLQDIPVIFMTARGDPIDELAGFRLGAVDYITKPIKVELVFARLKTHLSLYKIQQELKQKNIDLEVALSTIKTIIGLVPLCAWCNQKIRDEQDNWVTVQTYIQTHSYAKITHSMCPECTDKFLKETEGET